MDRQRTVIRERDFEDHLAVIVKEFPRAGQFVEGAEWVLSRDPLFGFQVALESPVWFLPIQEVTTIPPIHVYYTFDDDHVWLLEIRVDRLVWDSLR